MWFACLVKADLTRLSVSQAALFFHQGGVFLLRSPLREQLDFWSLVLVLTLRVIYDLWPNLEKLLDQSLKDARDNSIPLVNQSN